MHPHFWPAYWDKILRMSSIFSISNVYHSIEAKYYKYVKDTRSASYQRINQNVELNSRGIKNLQEWKLAIASSDFNIPATKHFLSHRTTYKNDHLVVHFTQDQYPNRQSCPAVARCLIDGNGKCFFVASTYDTWWIGYVYEGTLVYHEDADSPGTSHNGGVIGFSDISSRF